MHLDWCKTGEKSLKIQLLSGRNWFLNMLECSCDSEMNYILLATPVTTLLYHFR